MIPTVSRPLRTKPVTTDNLSSWAREELLPLLQQVRQSANYIARQQATIITAGTAAFTTIWVSADLADGAAVRFDAQILGVAFNLTDKAMFTITGLFFNSGTVQQEPATVVGPTINPAGYVVRFLIVLNHIEVQVQDAGTSVNWTVVIDAQEGAKP